jgi:hypothetical protein
MTKEVPRKRRRLCRACRLRPALPRPSRLCKDCDEEWKGQQTPEARAWLEAVREKASERMRKKAEAREQTP